MNEIERLQKENAELKQQRFHLARICNRYERLTDELLAKLKVYEQAEADGLLVRLPCKIGDTVYVNPLCLYIPHKIKKPVLIECKIIAFKKIKHRRLIMLLKPLGLECFIGRASYRWFSALAIDKTVFLTREEAEQALKEAQE